MLAARQQRALSAASSSSSSSSSPASFVRSPCTPSTSGQRRGEALVAHADAFCRDKVSLQRTTIASKGETYKLTFVAAGGETKEISCPDDKYILDAAEAGGLDLPATCRGGICGACVARVTSGTFDSSDIADLSFTLNEDEQAKGMALLCMTRATSDLVLETQSDWGYGLGLNDWQVTGKFSAKPDPLMGSEWSSKK